VVIEDAFVTIKRTKIPPVDVVASCYVCGGHDFRLRYTVCGWNIVTCKTCGFVFVNPRYNETGAAAIYNEAGWFFSGDGGRKNYAVSELASVQRAEKVVAQIADHKPGTHSLLDIGCGLGYVLDAGRRAGWDVTGIDLSQEGVAACREKGHTAFAGDLKTVGIDPDRTFDIITAFDVFEHVCDPLDFLAALRKRASKDALIVLQVPNVRSFAAMLHGRHWQAFILPEHLNYFSSATIRKILARGGFTVREVFSEPSLSFGLRNSLRAHFAQTRFESAVAAIVDGITLFKRHVFYPPVNWLFRKTALEASLLVVYAQLIED
jgi:2-polyprenyl-3-methyl-5-hydroxy-6-metoxy-1,4-benzoquinol methylase